MQLFFVGHSSFLVRHEGIEVLCDPWLGGRVFHDGWDVYSPVTLTIDDFPHLRYLWFSHEHPDHFHVPTLRSIEPDRRAQLTVLFQQTMDSRVADFCRDLGFAAVIELQDTWTTLDQDLDVRCAPFHEGNSWIAFRGGGATMLNLNDCGVRNIEDARRIKQKVGHVDVLLTQFSYAAWIGNPDQRDLRARAALDKLEMVKLQVDEIEPDVVIPIASYVYFCHPENFYLNDEINKATTTRDYLRANTTAEPIVLYNGDSFHLGGSDPTDAACLRYDADLRDVLARGPLELHGGSVGSKELIEQAAGFVERLRSSTPWYVRRLLRPATIFLWDHVSSVELSTSGLRPCATNEGDADVAMHSESLSLCLRLPFGIDTLGVSGRMHQPAGGRYRRFYKLCRPALLAMRGERLGFGYIARSLWNMALVRLGRRQN